MTSGRNFFCESARNPVNDHGACSRVSIAMMNGQASGSSRSSRLEWSTGSPQVRAGKSIELIPKSKSRRGVFADNFAAGFDELRRDLRHDAIADAAQHSHSSGYPGEEMALRISGDVIGFNILN